VRPRLRLQLCFCVAAALAATSARAYGPQCELSDSWRAGFEGAEPIATKLPPPVPQEVQGPPLDEAIGAFIKKMRRQGLLSRDERTAWSVYDISRDVELAGINQDDPMQTASLIKPFIALAYFDAVADGRKTYTPETRRKMERMIRDSDNGTADWFLKELGGPAAVQKSLKKKYPAMLQGLSLVEFIPKSGRTFRNKASVHDYTRFLHELWADALPSSAEIKRVMQLPKRNRLMRGAKEVPDDTVLYDKTGSTSRLCGDMGILVAHGKDGREYPYILVGVIEKSGQARHYMSWIHRRGDLIREVSNMAYKAIAARYGLLTASER
jgi:beta-lactamase class A